jgi:hypothetical protein
VSDELIVPEGAKPEPQAEPERPLLSVALGNVVVTPHGVEIPFVFPKEVLFTDDEIGKIVGEESAPS